MLPPCLSLVRSASLDSTTCTHTQVALEFIQGAEDLAVAHTGVDIQLLSNDLGFFRRRSRS